MTALRRLLDTYDTTGGTGSSLINFFHVPGVADQFVARDIILLQSLINGLDLFASDEMAPAFGNSTELQDYRWGYLHRIVFAHPLGPALSIPPAGSPLNVSPELPGLSRAGGFGAVDASSHSARADGLNEFMFDRGPNRRVVATMTPDGPDVLQVIPGGQSGAPGSPYQVDQLFLWLVNAFHLLPVSLEGVLEIAVSTETFACGDAVVGPGEQCDDGNSDNNDGCNTECRIAPIISCGAPSASADPESCTAMVACDLIATCVDPAGGSVSVGCAPGGPYAIGTTGVSIVCNGSSESTAVSCPVTVVDDTPPTVSVALDPDSLWPPNHRMVDITAMPNAADSCGAATVVLESITSSEPDNDTGIGDGDTVDDIQGAELGTADVEFRLRAERAGSGPGRTYTVTYTATDESGNQASAMATVVVAHDQGGVTEPILITAEQTALGTALRWSQYSGQVHYNVVRANLSDLRNREPAYDLGTVTCLESASHNENTDGNEDADVPAPGEVFIYMVEFDDGGRSSYGTVSAGKPRMPRGGDCQ
jgi:cysteine-rich repeat protein